MEQQKIIYVDMDDTLCDYSSQYSLYQAQFPDVKFPQSVVGFFEKMVPKPDAIEVAQALYDHEHYKVYILTAPSLYNPPCYSEKRLWVEGHLGFQWVERLIIANDKSLLKGDYLVDDHIEGRGQEKFEGELIHFSSDKFPDWKAVGDYFRAK